MEDSRGTAVKASSGSTPRKRVLFVATEDWFFRSHFLPMARGALAAGLDVAVAARTSEAASAIAAQGIRVIPIALSRGRLNPFGVLREAFNLWRLIAREHPDILHLIALRAILVGNLAATFRGNCPTVNSITGLGFLGVAEGRKIALVRRIIWPIFTILLRRSNSWILSDNEDDARVLGGRAHPRVTVIGGAGVDPDYFSELPTPTPYPVTAGVVARMLWSKGIDTAVEAQTLLRQRNVDLRLILAGPIEDETPNALPRTVLDEWNKRPGILWVGRQSDVRSIWRDAHVAVLATRGGEGLPRALLEAAACGRPIITTDVPGCRDFVRDGIEGFLVAPGDPHALADAMAKLVRDSQLRESMGKRARARVVSAFTEQQVRDRVAQLYISILQRSRVALKYSRRAKGIVGAGLENFSRSVDAENIRRTPSEVLVKQLADCIASAFLQFQSGDRNENSVLAEVARRSWRCVYEDLETGDPIFGFGRDLDVTQWTTQLERSVRELRYTSEQLATKSDASMITRS